MEILIILCVIIGIPATWLMKKCIASLDRLDYACEKHFNYNIHSFKAWMLWLGMLGMLGMMFWFYKIQILGMLVIWLFLRHLIAKTSPAVAWRVVILYSVITLCSFTVIALIAGYIFELLDRSQRRDTYRRQLSAEYLGLHDMDRGL